MRAAGVGAKRLSHLSLRQLQIELFRFGRRRVHEHQDLAGLIEELMLRPAEATERSKFVRILVTRDALYLAHHAGLHGHCTELFLSTLRQAPASLALSEAVVDSAFADGSAAVLSAVTDAAVQRLVASPDDAATEASLYRLVWLCSLKCLELKEERALLLSPRPNVNHRSHSKSPRVRHQEAQELDEKLLQYENIARDAFYCLSKVNARIGSLLVPNVEAAEEGNSPIIQHGEKRPPLSSTGRLFDRLWAASTRFARYHYADDGGEAQFYKYLYDNNWLRNKHAPHSITTMIRSCNRSQDITLVKEYFSDFVISVSSALCNDEAVDGAAMDHHTPGREKGGEPDALGSTGESIVGQPSSNLTPSLSLSAPSPAYQFPEVVVHTYFQTLVNSRAYQDVVDAAEHLFSTVSTYQPSASVLAVISRAAGETRNMKLAMRCATLLFTAKEQQKEKGSAAALSGSFSGEEGPNDGFNASFLTMDAQDRGLPSSYEVFVTLMSLAKCHASSFLPLLSKVRSIPSICPNDEESLCLRLHYLRRSPRVLTETNHILRDIREKPIASVTLLSVRNMTLLLILLQQCNHDNFLEHLRDFLNRSVERKTLWAIVLLQWAEIKRRTISDVDRRWIINILREIHSEHQKKIRDGGGAGASAVSRGAFPSSQPQGKKKTTNSMWHTMTTFINESSTGDAALQRGAVAVFLADCCASGFIPLSDAFASAHGAALVVGGGHVATDTSSSDVTLLPQWPTDDASLRFTLKPSGKLYAGLRSGPPPHSLLAPSSCNGSSVFSAIWDTWEGGTSHPNGGEGVSQMLLRRSMVHALVSLSA